jgi:serine O-acetyltransferase
MPSGPVLLSEVPPADSDPGSPEVLFDIDRLVSELSQARRDWRGPTSRSAEPGGRELPSRDAVSAIVEGLRAALFPMRLGPPDLRKEAEDYFVGHTLDTVLQLLLAQARLELAWASRHEDTAFAETPDARAIKVVRAFAAGLPTIRRLLDGDVEAAFSADPAARSVDEVLICYPGVQAMILYRIAHRLHNLGLPLIARLIAELAHGQTGIDIHPGAVIGSRFFIDHGTGVVIGGTAIIGSNVQLFQAVTLGAKSFPTDADGKALKGLPRHPIVEDDVVIYSGATVLGRVTIGRGAVIGGNVWITEDVAPYAVISQAKLLHNAELSERRHA